MSAFESGRRLCLLFEAGRTRYAVEATSVTEVASPDSDERKLRGSLELQDLSRLLDGPDEQRPGMAVVLDTSPTLAVRIKRVLEVADVSKAQVFQLPPALMDSTASALRAAVLHDRKLFLELRADAVPHAPRAVAHPERRPHLLDAVPERGLVFESRGALFGVALGLVSQVVPVNDAFTALPSPAGMVAGLFAHTQILWPIVSAPALLGGTAEREAFFVLTELAGQNVGLCAARVLGVYEGFRPGPERGQFLTHRLDRPALFLDLQRMFA